MSELQDALVALAQARQHPTRSRRPPTRPDEEISFAAYAQTGRGSPEHTNLSPPIGTETSSPAPTESSPSPVTVEIGPPAQVPDHIEVQTGPLTHVREEIDLTAAVSGMIHLLTGNTELTWSHNAR